MASESNLRKEQWLKRGCNSFGGKNSSSLPISFWTDYDIWEYIKKYNIDYSKIYNKGEIRTGCMFCLFGYQYNGEGGWKRFERMKTNHPKQYKVCVNLGIIEILNKIKENS